MYGTLRLTLLSASKGTVNIGMKNYLDEYDFKMDGRLIRDFALLHRYVCGNSASQFHDLGSNQE